MKNFCASLSINQFLFFPPKIGKSTPPESHNNKMSSAPILKKKKKADTIGCLHFFFPCCPIFLLLPYKTTSVTASWEPG